MYICVYIYIYIYIYTYDLVAQQQKLLPRPRFGAFRAYLAEKSSSSSNDITIILSS